MSVVKLSKDDIEKATGKHKQPHQPKEKKKINVPMLIVHIFEILFSIGYAVILAFGSLFLPKNNDFWTSFNIFQAANPLPIARLLSYACFAIIVATLVRILLKGLTKSKKVTRKIGVAVLQLLANLVKYVLVIIIVCLALNAVGVDATAILAGLGIVALIIGLGVTSLIEDIVAGIFIIAERLFDVGDIIVINGFRGTVVSIGVRSTKLADVGGDILTMRNSAIGSLVNLTDRTSCAAISIPLAPEEQLTKVEEIITNAHIEHIRDTCDKMAGDPIYLGLTEITATGNQMLLFIAACKEEDKYDVERALFHGLKAMFDENHVKLGYKPDRLPDQQ